MVLLVLGDDLPELRVDGGPFEGGGRLETYFDRMEFEVVGLELELVDEILLVLEEEAVSGCG